MKRFVLLLVLCMFITNATYAQLTKSQEGYLERQVNEALAKDKKAKEEKMRKELEMEQRHEQLRREQEENFNRQMNNLNQYNADDFLNMPQQQGIFRTTANGTSGSPNVPITAQPRNGNIQTDANNRNYVIGTPSYSGNNYTGDRYNLRPAGFDNRSQRQQVRVPAHQIRGQYKPAKTMRQGVVNIRHQDASPRVTVQTPLQQPNMQNVGNVQTQQRPVRQQAPVQEKVAWVKNGKIVLDPSKPIYMKPQSPSSADLTPVGMSRIDYATEIRNITVYNVPQEAYNLSDRDNKTTVSANVRKQMNVQRESGLTTNELARLAREDAASGFESINNPAKWANIYGRVDSGTMTVPSRIAIQKR